MTGLLDPPESPRNPVLAMREVVSPGVGRDFIAPGAAEQVGVGRYIRDGLGEQRLVP